MTKLVRTGRGAAAIWLAAHLLGGLSAADAQTLTPPSEVVLYIHSEMKRTEFVERLECALKHVLVAPVSTQELKFALGSDLRASPTQLDTERVANAFLDATINDGGPRTFKYLFLPFDLKKGDLPFVYDTSFTSTKAPIHVGIMSTARLDTRNPDYPDEQNSAQTAYRLYKLMMRSLARLAGFKSSNSCVLSLLRNLTELDRQSKEFCADDRATLVAAGILKPQQDVGTACALISLRSPPSLNLLAGRQQ
jgi:predicted Zn-dependent protease